jgi:hypothetical protein
VAAYLLEVFRLYFRVCVICEHLCHLFVSLLDVAIIHIG